MVEQSIGIGLLVSLIFSEVFGIAAGGMVVPGYIALEIHHPLRLVGTILAALATYGTVRLLSQFTFTYGRRAIVLQVLLGFIYGAITRRVLYLEFHGMGIELAAIGYIIPGLIAHWMQRQGVVETLCVMTIAAVLVRLILILLWGGAILP